MKRNTVVAIGVVGIMLLEVIALLKGMNGVAFATALGAIGALVGYVFRGVQEGSPPAKVLALLVALGLVAGCGSTISACYVHPEYGQICVEYDGKLHLRADLKGEKLAQVVDWLRKKGVDVDETK